jgi:small subunit ribosomal protein S21
MTFVIVREDEAFEKALRRFNKSCERAGILADVKKHQHFEKPSERRKRKLAQARRKSRRFREEY